MTPGTYSLAAALLDSTITGFAHVTIFIIS
jgi:hypothetical protein